MAADPEIVDKVRKFLALSRSDNVHEAALAAERAHKLMLEHSIALSDVSDVLPADVIEDEISDARMMAVWRFGLLTACARSYYCSTVRVEEETTLHTTRIRAVIMGRKDDVAAVRCLFEHFEKEIDRLYEEKWSRQPGTLPRIDKLEAGESWKRGAVVAIQEKLQGQRMMFEREHSKALVLGDKARAAVGEYQEKKYPETYRPNMTSAADRGFHQGYRAGLDLSVPSPERKRIEEKAK